MNAESLQSFIETTHQRLPEICGGITAYWQDVQAVGELEKSLALVQQIKNEAALMELQEISEIAASIAGEMQEILFSRNIITTEQNQFLLEQILNLEYLLTLTGESAAGICADESDLNEDFFGELELAKLPEAEDNHETAAFSLFEELNLELERAAEPEKIESAELDEFEIDAEMLEIFALEAEDHLKNMSANLVLLESAPDNSDALLEIRRSAHTLKGSAGIIGFKKISALAHRVEDLLDYIAENEIAGNKSVFEVLLASTDCLESLTREQNSAEIDRKISDIYRRFDSIAEALRKTPAAESVPEIQITEPVEKIDATVLPDVAEMPAEIFLPTAEAVVGEIVEPAENEAQSPNLQSRSVVRVSLERLDDLVKLVSEMIASRSVFERRLVEFERQIQELVQTTNRLRRSTGKLEIDYEASTLGSKTFGFQNYNPSAADSELIFENKDREFDSLEFDHYTEFHQTTRELIETAGDVSAIHNEFDNLFSHLGSLFDTQRHLVEEMQENLMRLRMVPLNSIAARLHRTVRVTANDEGKQAELEIENGDVEIDTQILDSFVEPLLHLLRNAVAHGIETPAARKRLGKSEKGKIRLRAHSEGTHIVFVISDDGQGISASSLKEKAISAGFISPKEAAGATDEEAFSLIFLPGLSTSPQINEVSGRGVGMNIVKSSITRRQGTISIKSEPQKGTAFTIRLPMSLAVTRALLIKANEQTFAFPIKIVKQIVEISNAEYQKAAAERKFDINNVSYKFFDFNQLINVPPKAKFSSDKNSVLLIETSEAAYALAVDQISRPEEIVIKPLGSLLRNVPELIGATIMGDGSVVPVLDLAHLIREKESARGFEEKPEISQTENFIAPSAACVLIVDDSPSVRHVNSKLVKNAGWQPLAAKDGLEALEILQTAQSLPLAILTDVEMPRMDGYEFLAAIRRQENLSRIPVIMITSRAGDKHRRKACELGVSAYISKPFEETELIGKIKELTGLT